jgi:hypothetical protein
MAAVEREEALSNKYQGREVENITDKNSGIPESQS